MAEMETEILKFKTTDDPDRPHAIAVNNVSEKFDGLLVQWWKHFGLAGKGLTIGDGGCCAAVKLSLFKNFPEVESVEVVDLNDADIIWDITEPPPARLYDYDWIICQAVIEHIHDPFCAIKHMAQILRKDGLLYLHTVAPPFQMHRHPYDCLRFMRDFFFITADKLSLTIVDICFTESIHINVLYRR